MPIIKNGAKVDDLWLSIGDDDAIPAGAPVIVSLARWHAEREALVRRNAPVGVRLKSDEQAESIAAGLEAFDLIAIEFPTIGDGRGYSNGRLLRDRYGFAGELRATGALVRDVFPLLHRCGFDAVEARDNVEAAAWHEALGAITANLS